MRDYDDCACGPDCDDEDGGCVASCRCEHQDCIETTRDSGSGGRTTVEYVLTPAEVAYVATLAAASTR